MTIKELLQKLEECRYNVEDSNIDCCRDAFDTLNEVIYDLENEGISGDPEYGCGCCTITLNPEGDK